MFEQILEIFRNNQFFSGGFLLGVVGAILGFFYKIPVWFNMAYNYFATSVTITFAIHESGLSGQIGMRLSEYINRKSRNNKYEFTISADTSFGDDTDEHQLIVGNFTQYFWDGWRLCRFSKHSLDKNNVPHNSITLQIFPCSKTYLHQLFAEVTPPKTVKSKIHYIHNAWSDTSIIEKDFKTFDCIHLNDKKKEIIKKDLDRFLAQKQFYKDRRIKYKRGYLFSGPPGNGKSSLTEAIASYVKKDIFKLSLGGQIKDSDLIGNLGRWCTGKVVAIEDVDCLFEKRDQNNSQVSFSSFLNFLDGINSPEDCIFVITTNHPERLDPALLRTGRADFTLEIDRPTNKCIEEYVQWFFGKSMPELLKQLVDRNLNMSDVQNMCLSYKDEEDIDVTAVSSINDGNSRRVNLHARANTNKVRLKH